MELTIKREELLKPLQLVSGAVERRQTLPILSNVLISAKTIENEPGISHQLSFTATDLEVELVGRINIDSIEVQAANDPAQEILNKIEKADIDLLAIGSHSRRRFLRNLFLGKVAYNVVRKANSSVLIFKAPT